MPRLSCAAVCWNRKPATRLSLTRNLVRESAELYANGEKEKAYQKAVDAYIDGYELAEPALFAKDASFGRSLEGLVHPIS